MPITVLAMQAGGVRYSKALSETGGSNQTK